VRIAAYSVQEKEHKKDIARSAHFPLPSNDSTVAHLTDTQFIGFPRAASGQLEERRFHTIHHLEPRRTHHRDQWYLSDSAAFRTLENQISNDRFRAELKETRNKARQTENEVALRVHQLYYRILVLQSHKEAAVAKIQANESLQAERVQQVKFGSTLEEEAIESRAQSLEAKQDLLTTELQLSDLTMQLDDAIGLPLNTLLALDPSVRQVANTRREQCLVWR
jgi:hypothetical protein